MNGSITAYTRNFIINHTKLKMLSSQLCHKLDMEIYYVIKYLSQQFRVRHPLWNLRIEQLQGHSFSNMVLISKWSSKAHIQAKTWSLS